MSQSAFITIKRTEVPIYLRLSGLYLSLDDSDTSDDEFSVTADCMKWNISIQNAGDLEQLLLTMRYWILERFPIEVISFLIGNFSVI